MIMMMSSTPSVRVVHEMECDVISKTMKDKTEDGSGDVHIRLRPDMSASHPNKSWPMSVPTGAEAFTSALRAEFGAVNARKCWC